MTADLDGPHALNCAIWTVPLPGPDDCDCPDDRDRPEDAHARREPEPPRRAWRPRATLPDPLTERDAS